IAAHARAVQSGRRGATTAADEADVALDPVLTRLVLLHRRSAFSIGAVIRVATVRLLEARIADGAVGLRADAHVHHRDLIDVVPAKEPGLAVRRDLASTHL